MNTQTATQLTTKPTEFTRSHDTMAGSGSPNPLAMAKDAKHDGSGFLRTPEQLAAIHQKNFKEKEEVLPRSVFDSRILETQREIDALQTQLAAQAASMKNAKDEQVALFKDATDVESIEGGRGRKSFLDFIGSVLKNLKSREANTWSDQFQQRIGKMQGYKKTAEVQSNLNKEESKIIKYAG